MAAIRMTHKPPKRTGWYAYSHNEEAPYAMYVDEELLKSASDRYELANAVEIESTDLWSTRKLRKDELGGPE